VLSSPAISFLKSSRPLAIFDSSGKMLITIESPVGNVGHPSGYAKAHARKMLLATRSRLTDQQIDAIVSSLCD
jgi:hypothetical protein